MRDLFHRESGSRGFRAGPRRFPRCRHHAPAVAGTVAAHAPRGVSPPARAGAPPASSSTVTKYRHAPRITNVANYKTARTLARPLTPSARSLIKIDDSRCGRTLRRRQTRQSRHARHNNLLRAPTAAPAGPARFSARPRPWTAPPGTRRPRRRRPALLTMIGPARP